MRSTIAFARILDPPLAAWLRACPDWRHEPLVVLDVDEHVSPEARLRSGVCAVSPEAAALGARPGHTGAQARCIAPEVRAVVRSIAQEKAMVAALRDAAWSISPSIDLGDGGVYVDLSGLGRLHLTASDAAQALLRAARDVAVPIRVGVASTKPIALLASIHGDAPIANLLDAESATHSDALIMNLHPPEWGGDHRVYKPRSFAGPDRPHEIDTSDSMNLHSPKGGEDHRDRMPRSFAGPDVEIANPGDEEMAFLAALPLESLSVWVPSLIPSGKAKARSDDAAALVASFGLTCLGDVVALPRGALAERLGREGELLESLARGEHRPPLEPTPPVVTLEEVLELEGHLETFEPLGFLLRPAIERLMGRLVLRGLGCAALELHLSLDPRGVDARTVTVSVPTRDVTALLALIRLSVDARPPGAPVDGFRVVGHAGELRPTQLSLFAPAGPAPGALATTMARLSALVGPERVGSPRVPWTRRPGVVELAAFAPGPPPVIAEDSPERCPVRATRRVSPPLAVEVERDASGRLCAVHLEGQRRSVVRADGPFVVEGGWWSEERYRREEHDVTLSSRSSFEGVLRVRLVHDAGAHYVDAVYDG